MKDGRKEIFISEQQNQDKEGNIFSQVLFAEFLRWFLTSHHHSQMGISARQISAIPLLHGSESEVDRWLQSSLVSSFSSSVSVEAF